MGRDEDLDDLLDDRRADLEARFRELEHEAEIERLRGQSGGSSKKAPPAASAPEPSATGTATGESDPLADLKAAVDGSAPLERYMLVLCPHCEAKNRLSLTKVRTLNGRCGRCKKDLSYTKR
jgi:hypothetical protein